MILTDDKVINISNQSISSLKQIIGEYSFSLNEIFDVEIKIKLYKVNDDDNIHFTTSHFIHTPEQAGPYVTSNSSMPNQELALKRAIETITSYYEAAIRNEHEPSSGWLVVNELF